MEEIKKTEAVEALKKRQPDAAKPSESAPVNPAVGVKKEDCIVLPLSPSMRQFLIDTEHEISLINAVRKSRLDGFVDGQKCDPRKIVGFSEDGASVLISKK
jgi:hypothetical protein